MKSSIRVIWAILALVSLLTLAACGEGQAGTSPGGTSQEGPGVTTGGDQLNCPTPVSGTDTGNVGGTTGGTGGTAGDTGTGGTAGGNTTDTGNVGGTTGGTDGGTTSGSGTGGNTGDAGGNAVGGTGGSGGTGGAAPLECPTPGTR